MSPRAGRPILAEAGRKEMLEEAACRNCTSPEERRSGSTCTWCVKARPARVYEMSVTEMPLPSAAACKRRSGAGEQSSGRTGACVVEESTRVGVAVGVGVRDKGRRLR